MKNNSVKLPFVTKYKCRYSCNKNKTIVIYTYYCKHKNCLKFKIFSPPKHIQRTRSYDLLPLIKFTFLKHKSTKLPFVTKNKNISCHLLTKQMVGAVVRALASHQCVLGLIPGPGVTPRSSKNLFKRGRAFPDRIGIWKCWFLRRGENRSIRRKTSRSRVENQQQTQPRLGAPLHKGVN